MFEQEVQKQLLPNMALSLTYSPTFMSANIILYIYYTTVFISRMQTTALNLNGCDVTKQDPMSGCHFQNLHCFRVQ